MGDFGCEGDYQPRRLEGGEPRPGREDREELRPGEVEDDAGRDDEQEVPHEGACTGGRFAAACGTGRRNAGHEGVQYARAPHVVCWFVASRCRSAS